MSWMSGQAISAAMALSIWMGASLATTSDARAQSLEHPGCNFSGSTNVLVEGLGALRLSDVVACPGVRYEVIPGLIINGEPAVRLLPDEECAPSGSTSVTAEGGALARRGDGAGCGPASGADGPQGAIQAANTIA